MTVVKLILQIVLVVLSLLLTLLILMHKGKGGGLSDMFGGGLTQNAGSSGLPSSLRSDCSPSSVSPDMSL